MIELWIPNTVDFPSHAPKFEVARGQPTGIVYEEQRCQLSV